MVSYQSLKTIWGLSFACFSVFGTLRQLGGTGSQSSDFFRIHKFHDLNICDFKFAFHNEVNELIWSSGSGDIAK